MPAYNEHIGSMAALLPLERAVRKERLSPAGQYLEAATAPICQHVHSVHTTKLTAHKKITANPTASILYGKDLYYATFNTSNRTSWYAFFTKHCQNEEIIYLVRYISNQHVVGQFLNSD
jgi:hypothetical protein